MLKPVHAQEERKAAAEKMVAVTAELRPMKLTKAADLIEKHDHETLTYYGFPDNHWIKLRTNNRLERIMREIRWRTKMVGAFPDGKSCLHLAVARLRHIARIQWSTLQYMNMTPLLAEQTQAGAVFAWSKVRKILMVWTAPTKRHRNVPCWCCLKPTKEGAGHMKIRTLGIDIAKSVFQLHGVDEEGTVVLQKKFRRGGVLDFLSKLAPCLVGIEACPTGHFWGAKSRRLVTTCS